MQQLVEFSQWCLNLFQPEFLPSNLLHSRKARGAIRRSGNCGMRRGLRAIRRFFPCLSTPFLATPRDAATARGARIIRCRGRSSSSRKTRRRHMPREPKTLSGASRRKTPIRQASRRFSVIRIFTGTIPLQVAKSRGQSKEPMSAGMSRISAMISIIWLQANRICIPSICIL